MTISKIFILSSIVLAAIILLPSGLMLHDEPSSLASALPKNGIFNNPEIALTDNIPISCNYHEINHLDVGKILIEKFASIWPDEKEIITDNFIEGKVEKGDTIAKILSGIGERNAQHYINAISKIFSLSSFKAGNSYTVISDLESGRVKRFEYEINPSKRLIIEGIVDPKARLEKIEYLTFLESVNGQIEDNLFQAVADAGESPQLAVQLTELFGSEINFIKDLQEGDSFSVLIEKRYLKDEYKGYGRILAATFTNKGKTWEAFLFPDSDGNRVYYNRNGENLRKTLLQAPLAVTRMTSRFTHNRKHPILGSSRPHLGVDYGAPTGTPVKAVGSGIVLKRGWAGGYGNQIIIKHDARLESLYSHLSGFANGLREGQKVRQGQVIGFVGSTGLSTGPHLDFRLRQGGNFINPTKAINPRGAPVPSEKLRLFKEIAKKELNWLQGEQIPANYTVDSLVPLPVSLDKKKPAKKADIRTKQRDSSRVQIKHSSKKRS